jgi:hypothetical protein
LQRLAAVIDEKGGTHADPAMGEATSPARQVGLDHLVQWLLDGHRTGLAALADDLHPPFAGTADK